MIILLPIGKLDPRLLEKIVFRYLGAARSEVVVGPGVGIDAAVLRLGSETIVFKSDPIVGATKRIGWLAINIVSNDVACMGARPIAVTLTLLMPEGSKEGDVEDVMRGADKAARSLGISIVGGHTEVAQGLRGRPPIVVASAIGKLVGSRIYSASNAQPGDLIIATKGVALEGTSILAEVYGSLIAERFGREFQLRALRLGDEISVVREALLLAESGLPNAMHDPTDGGLLEALYEMAEASGTGFVVYRDRVPVREETLRLSKLLNFDPLRLISSGMLLATVPERLAERALGLLRSSGIQASVIGRVVEGSEGRVVVHPNGLRESINEPVVDELWRLLE